MALPRSVYPKSKKEDIDDHIKYGGYNISVLQKCWRCHEEKPATSKYFGKNNSRKNGLAGYCKECAKEIGKERYKASKEKNKQLKECKKCGKMLPVSEYHKDKYRKDGYYPRCKKCVKEEHAQKYKMKSIKKGNGKITLPDDMIKDIPAEIIKKWYREGKI